MSYIACLCEGAAEQAVIELLLDAEKLIFTRDEMLEGEPLRCRSASKFEAKYLRKGFSEKITIYRILDSRRERETADSHLTTVSCFYKLCIDIKLQQKSTPASPLHP